MMVEGQEVLSIGKNADNNVQLKVTGQGGQLTLKKNAYTIKGIVIIADNRYLGANYSLSIEKDSTLRIGANSVLTIILPSTFKGVDETSILQIQQNAKVIYDLVELYSGSYIWDNRWKKNS